MASPPIALFPAAGSRNRSSSFIRPLSCKLGPAVLIGCPLASGTLRKSFAEDAVKLHMVQWKRKPLRLEALAPMHHIEMPDA
ncbi:hypothetical protein Moror_9489 [Moniliophthora roreri MCA 2997]|uniref:Uncharacterized protein n=2 Tax=Moniliophthora roreri TaxID=221103 RepID=V2Y2T4_MONRO|nr:hypothetical protein Moror_9489 [Moniliophthora roreri MCA 2997]KAI3599100.1 hypothetical protein WG66_004032 [Moniliophthora roreri]